jgi:two-component system cell cycle sensor histidine kinase/response regulator CckA
VHEQAQRKVLLVDDEEVVRVCVAAVLRRDGFQVLDAVDGLDALSLLREMRGAIDILVTDIKMPRMTGIELVKAVTADFPGIPVVYISGEPLRRELHNPGVHTVFLQKPFRPQAILEAVRSMILGSAVMSGA